MTGGKRLCLNMIVRNERANLERCLAALADQLSCWVIADTGSSDGTPDFIRSYFNARGLPGELHSYPFENFELARNRALDLALGSALPFDYLVLVDADMELMIENREFRNGLHASGYLVLQRTPSGLAYWNARLARRDSKPRYHGVTHEYLALEGETHRLPGVWFLDHATGANRADKFDRDVRLLSEAVTRTPDDHRSWFYLAQSFRDAGRLPDAVATYRKRAEMGGWEEEAWYARLQLARCLLAAGDRGGFLDEALAAFDQRPHRAEPLHDLARFYREQGEFRTALLFAEAGLRIPYPDHDILFLEDDVYQTGLAEEFSICAYYSPDPALKARGAFLCNALSLRQDAPAGCRRLARNNLQYYAQSIGTLLPSYADTRIGFSAPPGYQATNPSIFRDGDRVLLAQRCVNWEVVDGAYVTREGVPVHTRNYLLELSPDLEVTGASEILEPADLPPAAYEQVLGFEDIRPFMWRGRLWCSACIRQVTTEGWCRQVLARIDLDDRGHLRLSQWSVLGQDSPTEHQKNWMPLVLGDSLRFVTACDPVRLADDTGSLISESKPTIAADHFRGGSQLVGFSGGWLALVHEVHSADGGQNRRYLHRFIWLDGRLRLRSTTQPFYFREVGIEFAAGLAWHPDDLRLLISFGVGDAESWIAGVTASEVATLLTDIGDPASNASRSAAADSRPRAPHLAPPSAQR
jgi:glycosyltransferase involved in cell wall biosynthesis